METLAVTLLDHRDRAVSARIHALQIVAYSQEARLLGVTLFPPLRRTIEDVQRASGRFWGASRASNLVGVVSVCSDNSPTTQRISSLVVHPDFQRCGIGRRLVSTIIAAFEGQALVVSTGALNLPALNLYRKFGFEEKRAYRLGAEKLPMVDLHRLPS